MVEVSAARKPSSWVPPSWVLIVLAKVKIASLNEEFHCIAISTVEPSSSPSKYTIVGCTGSLVAFRCDTKSLMPPSNLWVTSTGSSPRSSRSVIERPALRKAISRRRVLSVSKR